MQNYFTYDNGKIGQAVKSLPEAIQWEVVHHYMFGWTKERVRLLTPNQRWTIFAIWAAIGKKL